ncbi:MAG: HAMP domain-containing sensor histidine kinase [Agriterribacter sp.]
METLLQYCVALLKEKADEKNQQINLQTEPLIINANRQKVWRVISNLVNNAIKFSPQNSAIDIAMERRPASVVISIEDAGIGIPENIKERMFTNDIEISRPGTSGEESHGLGLIISKTIMEEHKGKIWFESYVGKGTIFYVEFPVTNKVVVA